MTPKEDWCSCCEEERLKEKKNPRQLKRLPSAVLQGDLFKHKGKPVRLCVVCDGDAYENALAAHKARTEENKK